MYRNRNMGINHIKARKDHRCYGMGLGIIILDDVYPGFPGDVRNASAYPFPIQYEIAEGVDILALVHAEDKSPAQVLLYYQSPNSSSTARLALRRSPSTAPSAR